MRGNKIDRHKVIIFVRRYGKPFRFYRSKKDDYGEPSEDIENINTFTSKKIMQVM